MFGQYYDRSQYEERSSIGKLAGFGFWAGVTVMAGIGGSRSGAFKSLAKGLYDGLGQPNLGMVSKLTSPGTRISKGSMGSAVNNLLSDEVLAHTNGLRDFTESIISESIGHKRSDVFLSKMRESVDEGSLNTFDGLSARLKSRLADPLKETELADARNLLMGSQFLDDFGEMTKGVQFNFDRRTELQKTIGMAAQSAYAESVKRKIVTDLMSDDQNKTIVMKAMRKGIRDSQKKYGIFDSLTPQGFDEVKVSDLFNPDGTVSRTGQRIDREVQMAAGLGRDESFVQEMMRRHNESVAEMFGDQYKETSTASQHAQTLMREFRQSFMESKTGFVMDETGNVISKAYLGRTVTNAGQSFLNGFQAPLLPGVFQVPLGKMFSFLKEDNRFVRNLGRALAQPELQRMGFNLDERESLIGIGRSVLRINPSGRNIEMIDGNFRMMPKRFSKHIEDMARIRSQNPETPTERVAKIFDESSVLKKLRAGLAADPDDLSLLKRQLYDKQHVFMDPTIVNGQIAAIPTTEGLKMGIDKTVIRNLFDDALNIRATDLNYQNLRKLQEHDFVQFSPGLGSEIAMLLGKQASTKPQNIGEFLASAAEGLDPADLKLGDIDVVPSWVLDLARKADNPTELFGEIERLGLFSPDARTQIKQFPGLFRAIEQAQIDRSAFFESTGREGNVFQKLFQGFGGESTPTKPVLDLQEALLEQIQAAHGVQRMREIGVTKRNLEDLAGRLKTSYAFDQIDNPLTDALSDALGIDRNSQQFVQFMRGMTKSMVDDGEFKISNLNRVAKFLGSDDGLELLPGYNVEIGAKLKYNRMTNFQMLQQSRLTNAPGMGGLDIERDYIYQQMYQNIRDLSNSEEIAQSLRTRFKHRNFEPYRSDTNLSAGSDYYLVGSGVTPLDILSDPLEAMKRFFGSDNGQGPVDRIMNSTAGYFDPHTGFGVGSYFNTVLGQMSNRLAVDAGLGLSVQDKMTISRTFMSYGLKRVAPLVIGLEFYKNFNEDANNIGVPGLDDIGANALAHANLMGAGIKDFLGLTSLNKSFISAIPGMEQYFSPRSREEYEEYLLYGNEAVREGRGWLIGNRNPATGSDVSYYRPNFYRRWKSGWTGADNVDIANTDYSFLPTLTNPLAPLNRLMNPNWWIEKHQDDRPYMDAGYGAEYGTKYSVMGAAYGFELDEGGVGFGAAGTAPYGGGPGVPGYYGGMGGTPTLYMAGNNLMNGLGRLTDRFREQSGLYGSILKLVPFLPSSPVMPIQTPGAATDFRRYLFGNNYGEVLGPTGEFLRRLVGFPDNYKYAYSPYRNNMPSWLPERFHSGDPYMRVDGPGELQLPGQAFELTHPWVKPMKVRGSMIGMTEDEIIQKWLDPTDFEESDYLEYGTWAHQQVQRQLDAQGLLMSAEVPIYDEANNLSGTIDAVVRGPNGPTVVEIKTQNSEDFLREHNPDKYIEQLNFYLNTTGTDMGYLAFVNSSDPEQVRLVPVMHDEERFSRTMEKIERARSRVRGMVENKQISPFETYDILSRLEVLGKVAPESRQFKELVEFAEGGGFNANEKMIFDRIKSEAHEMTKRYNTYAYRDPVTAPMVGKVLAINPDGSILTNHGNIRLAGVEFDEQSFIKQDADEVLGEYGIAVGRPIMFDVNAGLNANTMRDTTTAARIGSINKRIIEDGIGNAMSDLEDPMDYKALSNRGIFRNTIEWIMHRDNIISNKFFRVRSALEQYERGEVYGTDFATWSKPFDTFLKPTIQSMISKDPITSGLQSGLIASFFFKNTASKIKAAKYAGLLAAGVSSVRMLGELITQKKWIPGNVKDQNEIDEYYDALEYIKQTTLAERARQDAYIYEGLNLDLDQDTQSTYRRIMEKAEERAAKTMYAFDVAKGSLDQAIEAMPERNQQIAKEIVLYGSAKDKARYYSLLPDSQKRLLGSWLGKRESELPKKQSLDAMFRKWNLPDADWSGWGIDQDLDLYADATSVAKNTNVVGLSKSQRARLEMDKEIRIPRMDNPGFKNVVRRLEKLASEIDLPIQVDVSVIPSTEMGSEIRFDLQHDNSTIIEENLRRDSRRG